MRYLPDPERFKTMTTDEIRSHFMVEDLFNASEVTLHFIDLDRAVIGGVMPVERALRLEAVPALGADYFAERREIGVLNVGGPGRITVDGERFGLKNRDGLYIGRGSRDILFETEAADRPARFYLVSYPAHTTYPTAHVSKENVAPLELGTPEAANRRSLYKYFHPEGVPTAQLVMGFTEIATGSVWNTMPAHTHQRRTEIYFYFDLPADAVVFHLMGEPQQTRSIVVRDAQAVLSPGWSIHAGCGTHNYTFCWAMGGENQAFTDMQGVAMTEIR